MSAIKDGRMPIMLDKERYMLFSLNVMDEVEDKLGSIESMGDALSGKGRIKFIKWLFTLLLNEGAADGEEPLTERQIGKMIHAGNINKIVEAIYKAFSFGTRGTTEPPEVDDDDDGGEPKNATAGGDV